MLISPRERLLNRVVSCLRLDRKDPTHLHIELDALIQYLHGFGFIVPPFQYEQLVKKMLSEQVLNKNTPPGIIVRIAEALIQLAENILAQAEESARKNIYTEPESIKKVMTDG